MEKRVSRRRRTERLYLNTGLPQPTFRPNVRVKGDPIGWGAKIVVAALLLIVMVMIFVIVRRHNLLDKPVPVTLPGLKR
jgi:hypothetical protein